jgi:hypothetical protein
MGAVAPVHVELLAMKHTAEEHMVNLRSAGVLNTHRVTESMTMLTDLNAVT